MPTTICKFCLQPKPLLRAHIIPISLYPQNPNGDRMRTVLDGHGNQPMSTLRHGEYDSNLVCQECEQRFGPWDRYAKHFFVDAIEPSNGFYTDNGSQYLIYPQFDYRNLKLFFISLLWRAHATARPSFRHVDIGAKYEKIAKAMITAGDPGDPDDFAVFLVHFTGRLRDVGTSTTPRRIAGINIRVYETLLFGFGAYIKVDRRPFPSPVNEFQLADGKPLTVIQKPIEQTPFLRFAFDAISKAEAAKERLQMSRTKKP